MKYVISGIYVIAFALCAIIFYGHGPGQGGGEWSRLDEGNRYAIYLMIFLWAYLIPSFVAFLRNHHNAGAIFALNLLLGWTFLGWISAMIWSLTAPAKVIVLQQTAS
jgi:Superinfection immunity protein